MSKGWIGVDMDRTLAYHEEGTGAPTPGEPLYDMVDNVRRWLAAGHDVRIFTARVQDQKLDVQSLEENTRQRAVINEWCRGVFGRELPITNCKDWHLWVLFDDRACHVFPNTGCATEHGFPEELS